MAIDGVETGAFAEGGDDQTSQIPEARVFLESPLHVRDSQPQLQKASFWSFIGNPPRTQQNGFISASGDRQNGREDSDGNHILFSSAAYHMVALGSGWSDYTVQGGHQLIAAWGSDISFTCRYPFLIPAGKYSPTAGFYYAIGNQGGIYVATQLSGSVSFQIVSADLKQIIDVTPQNCGTTAQGLVAFSLDSVQVFGRSIGFFPQCKMTTIPNPWLVDDPPYFTGFSFGPTFFTA